MWHIHVLGKIQQIFWKEINLCVCVCVCVWGGGGGGEAPDILERDKYLRD